jgi:hypothetical protein
VTRRSREDLRENLTRQVNNLRASIDEQARMMGGCDDPTHPLNLGTFRDWRDFVDRVARPLVEADNDHDAEQAAMALYRRASPYYICAAMVIMANRLDEVDS